MQSFSLDQNTDSVVVPPLHNPCSAICGKFGIIVKHYLYPFWEQSSAGKLSSFPLEKKPKKKGVKAKRGVKYSRKPFLVESGCDARRVLLQWRMGAVSFIDRTLVLGVRMGPPAGGMADGAGGEGWVCGTGGRGAGLAGGQRRERALCRSLEEQWAALPRPWGKETDFI